MTDKARKRLIAEQEADFLLAYYGKSSATRLDRRASAVTAGYTPRMALWNANRLLKKYAERSFRECAEVVGINKPQLAVMFREVLETSEGRDAISSIRLMMANLGEQTDSASSQKPVSVNMPVMVIVGASARRMEALRHGGDPQELPPASDEDVIEVEAVAKSSTPTAEQPIEAPPATASQEQEKDARRLTAEDFSGRNLSEKPKGPSY